MAAQYSKCSFAERLPVILAVAILAACAAGPKAASRMPSVRPRTIAVAPVCCGVTSSEEIRKSVSAILDKAGLRPISLDTALDNPEDPRSLSDLNSSNGADSLLQITALDGGRTFRVVVVDTARAETTLNARTSTLGEHPSAQESADAILAALRPLSPRIARALRREADDD